MVAPNPNNRVPFDGSNPVPPGNRLAEIFRHYIEQDAARSPLSAEDVRVHARLTERLAVLHHERYGLWPKLRRLFSGKV
jgi:hypothetical protein